MHLLVISAHATPHAYYCGWFFQIIVALSHFWQSHTSCTLLLLFLPHFFVGCTPEATSPDLVCTRPSIEANARAVSALRKHLL